MHSLIHTYIINIHTQDMHTYMCTRKIKHKNINEQQQRKNQNVHDQYGTETAAAQLE
jgi:hypothetical protein